MSEPFSGRCVTLLDRQGGNSALVYVPTSEPPYCTFVIGTLAGGRRLLSDDECGALNGVEGRKATLEVAFEIVDVLQPDVEPQGRSTRRPLGRRTIVRAVERNHKALEAAP